MKNKQGYGIGKGFLGMRVFNLGSLGRNYYPIVGEDFRIGPWVGNCGFRFGKLAFMTHPRNSYEEWAK